MRLIIYILATSVAFFYCEILQSQNLIPNGGFEEYKMCPTGLKQLENLDYWSRANGGTPEFFHECGFKAEVKPYEGQGMAGIILLTGLEAELEYMQIPLKDSLQKDKRYCFSFYVQLKNVSPIAMNKMGAHFSKNRLYSPNWERFDVYPQVFSNKIIENKKKWQKVEGTFIAKGGERFLTFGNFFKKYLIQEKEVGGNYKNWSSYYYLDNFELYESSATCKTITRTEELPQKQFLKKHLVYFNIDEFSIPKIEKDRLDTFLKQIPENYYWPFKVVGHTDTDATFEYNFLLSQKRASSVVDFINKFGFSNTYKKWEGEKNPTNNEISLSEKALNRRVEISIE